MKNIKLSIMHNMKKACYCIVCILVTVLGIFWLMYWAYSGYCIGSTQATILGVFSILPTILRVFLLLYCENYGYCIGSILATVLCVIRLLYCDNDDDTD